MIAKLCHPVERDVHDMLVDQEQKENQDGRDLTVDIVSRHIPGMNERPRISRLWLCPRLGACVGRDVGPRSVSPVGVQQG